MPTSKKVDGKFYFCKVCKEDLIKVPRNHICYFPLPETIPAKPIPELENPDARPNYWTYDIESASVQTADDENLFKHRCNCVCLRPVYREEPRLHFHDIKGMVEYIIQNDVFRGATIFAHNGGGYDHQFIIHYLEKQVIQYDSICRPGSSHKYLEVRIKKEKREEDIVLKDFFMFMTQGLKAIAKSMNLPFQKGDFPHKFNNGQNDNYVGHFPEDEYYESNNKMNEKEEKEILNWLEEEKPKYCSCPENVSHIAIGYAGYEFCRICQKPNWIFQKEILKYCWLDTDILAMAIQKYRAEHIAFGTTEMSDISPDWAPTPIDPLNYLTQSSCALDFFMQGIAKSEKKVRPVISKPRIRSGFSKKALCWLEYERQKRSFSRIQHAGNNSKEYWEPVTQSCVDGYAEIISEEGERDEYIFEFFGCYFHACPTCNAEKMNSIHPTKKIPYQDIYKNTNDKIIALQGQYGSNFIFIWECQYDKNILPLIPDTLIECCNIMEDRAMFYGGRTEVFSAYAKSTEEEIIEHHDVTSMYPYVCAKKLLPIGKYELKYSCAPAP